MCLVTLGSFECCIWIIFKTYGQPRSGVNQKSWGWPCPEFILTDRNSTRFHTAEPYAAHNIQQLVTWEKTLLAKMIFCDAQLCTYLSITQMATFPLLHIISCHGLTCITVHLSWIWRSRHWNWCSLENLNGQIWAMVVWAQLVLMLTGFSFIHNYSHRCSEKSIKLVASNTAQPLHNCLSPMRVPFHQWWSGDYAQVHSDIPWSSCCSSLEYQCSGSFLLPTLLPNRPCRDL